MSAKRMSQGNLDKSRPSREQILQTYTYRKQMRERGEAFQYKVPEFSDLLVLKETMSKVQAILPSKEQ